MITLRRILCPIDFSEFSTRALAQATALARWHGATLVALHVHAWVPPPPTKLSAVAARPRLTPEIQETTLLHLRRLTEPARAAGVRLEHLVMHDDPVDAIVEAADNADLIVLGTHGRKGFQKLVLGSVTEQVLRRSTCPVLTVPRQAPAARADKPPVFESIVCPIDFSKASLRALEYALTLAKEANARLALLHVVDELAEYDAPELLRFDLAGFREVLERAAAERLGRLIPEGSRDWCRPEALVTAGKSYRSILDVAADRGADLIVMGVTGRGQLDRMLFGSTTSHVVRQATCPVLTLRTQN